MGSKTSTVFRRLVKKGPSSMCKDVSNGIWIDKHVFKLDLPMTEKALLGLLIGLCNNPKKYSWAGNQYLGDALGCSKDCVRKLLYSLKKKNLIIMDSFYGKDRRIWMNWNKLNKQYIHWEEGRKTS